MSFPINRYGNSRMTAAIHPAYSSSNWREELIPEPHPSHLSANWRQAPAPVPEIVNSDAQRLANKRQRLHPFSYKDLFCILRRYLIKHSDTEIDDIPNLILNDKPDLADFLLENDYKTIKRGVKEFGISNENAPELVDRVQKMFFWLHLQSLERANQWTPDVVFYVLRNYLKEGNGPEDIAALLFEEKPELLDFLKQSSFEDLHTKALEFAASETLYPGIAELLPHVLSRVYLSALEDGSISSHAKEIDRHIDLFLNRSTPQYWGSILGIENYSPSSWEELSHRIRGLLAAQTPPDPSALDQQSQKLRTVISALSSLEADLSLLDQIPGSQMTTAEQLQHLANGAFRQDQVTPLYPRCKELLPKLLDQLCICKQEFPAAELRRNLTTCFSHCQQKLTERPVVNQPLKDFFFIFDKPVYQASCTMIFARITTLLAMDKAERPRNFSKALQQSLAQFPQMTEQRLASDTMRARDCQQFLHIFWSNYTLDKIDLPDIMKMMVSALNQEQFATLNAAMLAESDESSRYMVLMDLVPEMLGVQPDFISIKRWCLEHMR